MTVTEYKIGDLIIDDSDKAVGFIEAILPELIMSDGNVISSPAYRVYWFSWPITGLSPPITVETSKGIKIYRKLA